MILLLRRERLPKLCNRSRTLGSYQSSLCLSCSHMNNTLSLPSLLFSLSSKTSRHTRQEHNHHQLIYFHLFNTESCEFLPRLRRKVMVAWSTAVTFGAETFKDNQRKFQNLQRFRARRWLKPIINTMAIFFPAEDIFLPLLGRRSTSKPAISAVAFLDKNDFTRFLCGRCFFWDLFIFFSVADEQPSCCSLCEVCRKRRTKRWMPEEQHLSFF